MLLKTLENVILSPAKDLVEPATYQNFRRGAPRNKNEGGFSAQNEKVEVL